MPRPLRIFIADDHAVVRSGVRRLVEEHPGWEVCGEASDGREAVTKAAELQPDIVLLDIGMPTLNGIEAARELRNSAPKSGVVFLTVHESDAVLQGILETGARGFLTKSDLARDLIAAIEAVERRRTFFSPSFTSGMLNEKVLQSSAHKKLRKTRLTQREQEVVQLLAQGKTSQEVADLLKLSVKTAETHRANVMRKLDLHSTADLVRYALRNGIVPL